MRSAPIARQWRGVALVAIVLLAVLIRGRAAVLLPVDFDEPITLEAATAYAGALERGDVGGLAAVDVNPEHPALVKVAYGLAILTVGVEAPAASRLAAARLVSLVFGVVLVAFVCRRDLLAGALLALHSLQAKYSAEACLESLPALAVAVCLLWGWESLSSRRHRVGVAVFLGIAAAGKLLVVLPALILLPVLGWRWRSRGGPGTFESFGLALLAVGTFWLLNPLLWGDPAWLQNSFFFHADYGSSLVAEGLSRPWWSPFSTLSVASAAGWHPGVFPIPSDALVFWGGMGGLLVALSRSETREGAVFLAAWVVVPLVFLAAWPTRWPQHLVGVVTPLCFSASWACRALALRARSGGRAVLYPRP